MTFPSDYADVVIANHVLEHVADDRKAVAEIRRVLSRAASQFCRHRLRPR